MPLDLPISDVKVYVEDAINQLGIVCTVDGVPTKIMVSDTTDSTNTMKEFIKLAVVSKDIDIKKGSAVIFADGRKAIVLTMPNDDMVSYSMRLLMCNSTVAIYNNVTLYDDVGDILEEVKFYKPELQGYIERITAREKILDLGIMNEAILKYITYTNADVVLYDYIEYKNKTYRVIDIDDVTDGILVLQLESVVT